MIKVQYIWDPLKNTGMYNIDGQSSIFKIYVSLLPNYSYFRRTKLKNQCCYEEQFFGARMSLKDKLIL